MRRRLLLTFAIFPTACVQTPTASIARAVVFFTADSAGLDESANEAIRGAAVTARANASAPVRVLGFAAPDTGTAAFNRALAQARAQAVADGLVAAGVTPARVRIESRGAVAFADIPT